MLISSRDHTWAKYVSDSNPDTAQDCNAALPIRIIQDSFIVKLIN